jgi:hypothetical protein
MSLPKHFPYRWQIIDFTFGVTLFTLLVNGTTMSWLVRRLGLNRPTAAMEFLGAYGAVEAARGVVRRLTEHRPVVPVSDELREEISRPYRDELAQAEAHLAMLRQKLAGNREKRRKLLWLQAFAVQRKVYLQRLESGLLSRRAQQVLERDLQNRASGIDREQAPLIEDQRLPADRASGLGVIRVLQQVLPGMTWLGRFQAHRIESITEQSLAVLDGAATVLKEMPQLQTFSAADGNDIEECREYYRHLEDMARARLDLLGESYPGAAELMRAQIVERLVYDARMDVIEQLRRTGELPEEIARPLRDRFEAGHAGEVVK